MPFQLTKWLMANLRQSQILEKNSRNAIFDAKNLDMGRAATFAA